MTETWKPVPGFEGRYEVSDLGRVASIPFMQRYVLRNGVVAFRLTKHRVLAQQPINSGYLIVHLHLDSQRTACTVHRLVALAFLGEPGAGETDVNHKDTNKQNNALANLEWLARTPNHIHAVYHGLNTAAVPCSDPLTGTEYPSLMEASRRTGRGEKYVRNNFQRNETYGENTI